VSFFRHLLFDIYIIRLIKSYCYDWNYYLKQEYKNKHSQETERLDSFFFIVILIILLLNFRIDFLLVCFLREFNKFSFNSASIGKDTIVLTVNHVTLAF
jgi:HD-like signal output (HDOD) protein